MTHYNQMLRLFENTLQVKLPQELLPELKSLFYEKSLSKNEILIAQGDLPKEAYFLLSGLMRSYYIDQNGNDITQYFIEPADLVGYDLLTQIHPSHVYIEAIEDCILMVANGQALSNLINSSPSLLKIWIKLLEIGIQFKIERQSGFLLKNATERYLDFKQDFPLLEGRVNQSHIASYLGINPVSLSRIRHTLAPH